MWKVKPLVASPMETRYRPILENLVPPDPMSQFHLKRGSPDEEFPDLCRNSTWMGKILTRAMYRRQFHRCTPSGVIFDDVIRPGLEEPGDWSTPVTVGCVAGDAQSYVLFCDFFDRVIEAHHGHKITSQTPEGDFNYDNVKVAESLARGNASSRRSDVNSFLAQIDSRCSSSRSASSAAPVVLGKMNRPEPVSGTHATSPDYTPCLAPQPAFQYPPQQS
ncbi:creatine kinase, testis isozyme-like [Epinephelus moara]|uniref:creatine kinase, testis isozyme-like n=1 Tax=Epinephelus moara TaxID=300413 RepID=UPI00214E5685|nr:creatine kinase, testis isozyme-like [Epinephelus moara]